MQPGRIGEKIGKVVCALLGSLIPMKYRPIEAVRVANAMLATMRTIRGKSVLSSEVMQAFGTACLRTSV